MASNTPPIQDFYAKVLQALSYEVNDDDMVSFVRPDGTKKIAVVDKRRLVLPSKARLREGFDEDLQPFHPLCENIARKGASPVLQKLQESAKAVLGHHFTMLAMRLLQVAADTSLHRDLPASCTEYLTKVPKADKKSVSDFNALLRAAAKKPNGLITVYLKNGGKLEGKSVNRMCVIRFPVMEALEEEGDTVYGVKIRKKDREGFSALLHYIMPFGDNAEEYSAGSNSNLAPFFDAFLRAYAKAAKQLNKHTRKYAKPIDLPLEEIPLTYIEDLDNLSQYHGQIGSIRGNEGTLSKAEEAEEAQAAPPPWEAQPSQTHTPAQPQPQAPVQPAPTQPQPAPQSGPAKQQVGRTAMSASDFLAASRPQPPQQPYYQQPPQPMPGYPQGYPHPQPAPGYPPQQPAPGYYPPQGGHPMAQQGGRPGVPTWLGGSGQPAGFQQPPQNPFSQAVHNPQPTNPVGGHGVY